MPYPKTAYLASNTRGVTPVLKNKTFQRVNTRLTLLKLIAIKLSQITTIYLVARSLDELIVDQHLNTVLTDYGTTFLAFVNHPSICAYMPAHAQAYTCQYTRACLHVLLRTRPHVGHVRVHACICPYAPASVHSNLKAAKSFQN